MKMRELRKLIVLMVFAFLGVATVMAATLVGTVKEAVSGEALMQASIRVLAARDSSLVKGAVTNNNGRFRIEGIRAGKYIVEASYVGFATQMRNITVADKDITLKPFELSESAIALKEATVVGVRTPIKVMEDTVEYNAEAYKTQPNAVVEDLLKRLPGVEVSSEGKITANGKEVSKILVDGKEFFSDDPTVASRNLPVEMVEKLQVVDRKSDLARLTGVDDGEDETVINLTVKKNMHQGWFGNVEAGYGTDDRYKGSFMINRFWNDNQITFLGGANNINEPGFADGSAGRFMRFGGSNGITKSQAFGINFNVGNGEKFRVGGNLLYSHTDRDTRTTSERQYLFTDSSSTLSKQSVSRDKGHNFRADFRMQWNPDSFNVFEFRPNISLNYNESASSDSSSTFAGGRMAGTEVTRSLNRASSDGHSFEFGGRLIYTHNFKARRGRSFSVMVNYNMSNVREKSNTYSFNKFFLLNDSVDLYDQYADNHTWSNRINTRVSWTEPIGDAKKGNFLTLAYNFSYRWNNADKLTYDHPVTFPDGWDGLPIISDENVFNQELSNRFRNDYMNQDIRLGYQHVSKAANLNVGLSLVPQKSKSIDLLDSNKNISNTVFNIAPYLRYRHKFSKSRSLMLMYNGRSSQPSLTQMQPVADMSDPLRIVVGNPDLKPTFTHSVRLRFQDFNSEAQRSIMAMLDGSFKQNSIISKTTYNNETGGQLTTYDNVNGEWNIRGMNMVSFPMPFNKAFSINNHIFLSYSKSKGYNNGLLNSSNSFSVGEMLGFAYRPEYFEFELRPSYNLQTVHNSVQTGANRNVHTYGGSFYATYNTPIGIVLNSDLNYNATSGYSEGFDTKTWMWNATISYQFLRGRQATVSLKAYDLLGQRSNISRSVTANYIDDSSYNSLTRYVMLSFSYRFNTMGNKRGGDRNGYGDGPMEGPGGRPGPPPGGGRGPMGPPPGM